MINFKKLLFSFGHAFRGLQEAWKGQSFRIQVAAALFVFALAWYFSLSPAEFMTLTLAAGFVLGLETVNTAIEKTLDMVRPEAHSEVKIIKDMCAAAVLIASLAAIVIGLKIFLPYFLRP